MKTPLRINFAGRIAVGLVSLGITPFYLRWLGAEGFGLIGFYGLLQAALGFFSAGLADAANREIGAQPTPQRAAAKRRAFGRAAWLVGVTSGGLVALASGWLARHWLNLDQIDAAVATTAIRLMGALLALQAPLDFHVAAFLGQHRPLAANVVLAGSAIGRAAAAVFTLRMIAGTIPGFFWSQVVVLALAAVACEFVAHCDQARHAAGDVDPGSLKGSVGFAVGMTAVALTTMLLGQADRLVLSRTLSLESFGLYSLAATLANLLYYLVMPVQASYYPVFTRAAAAGDEAMLSRSYHEACQRMAVLVVPPAAVLIFFARDVLLLWTRKPDVAEAASLVLVFLVGARVVSGLNNLPYTLQFSHGWTQLVTKSNVAAIVIFVPIVAWLALHHGAAGAAGGYFILSVPFLAFIVWRTHRRLLRGQAREWWRDTGPTLVVAFGVAGLGRWLEPHTLTPMTRLLFVAAASAATAGSVLLANRPVRAQFLGWLLPVKEGAQP